MNLIAMHKSYIGWWQRKLGLSNYALLWLTFLKGVVVALIVERLIVHWWECSCLASSLLFCGLHLRQERRQQMD